MTIIAPTRAFLNMMRQAGESLTRFFSPYADSSSSFNALSFCALAEQERERRLAETIRERLTPPSNRPAAARPVQTAVILAFRPPSHHGR